MGANACFNQPAGPAAPENFVQSERVDWTLLMDSVMGGISTANIGMDASDEYLKWTGQLSLGNNGRKLTGYNTMRFSARTTDPSRDFYATYSRDMGTGVMFQHPMKLSGEFKSYEMDFNDFSFQFMGWEAGWIPTLSGQMIRNVGMLVMDKNTTPFEVHIETIEGV